MDNLPCTLSIVGYGNLVTEMCEQTRQSFQRVPVIFDDKNTQPFIGI